MFLGTLCVKIVFLGICKDLVSMDFLVQIVFLGTFDVQIVFLGTFDVQIVFLGIFSCQANVHVITESVIYD